MSLEFHLILLLLGALLTAEAVAQDELPTQILVATGINALSDVEVVDLTTANGTACQQVNPFPYEVIGAVGANINGVPTICGGVYPGKRFMTILSWPVGETQKPSSLTHLNNVTSTFQLVKINSGQ